MDFDWLFKLVGGCQARNRHDCPERERGPWANEPVQSHLAHMPREHSGIVDVVHHGGNRDSLDAVSVRSGASKASAGREDHFFEARRDLKKHVRVLESEKDKLQDLGQVRTPVLKRLTICCQTTSVSAAHAAHCATTVPRVGRSYEHFPDGF
jgi:hypothetical protein